MMNLHKNNKNKNVTSGVSGFSLLELLLVVSVSAALLLGIVSILDRLTDRTLFQREADAMLRILDSADTYVSANFAVISAAVPNEGDTTRIDVQTLKDDGFLPNGVRDTNRYGQLIAVYFRNLGAVFSRDNTIEIMVLTEDISATNTRLIPEGALLEISRLGGATLGVVSNRPGLDGEIVSSAQEWRVPITAYSDSGIDVSVRYTASPTDEGGYLAAQRRASLTSAASTGFLYRVEIVGAPDLNVMSTNLMMNGHSIENAAALTVDRLEIGGETSVSGLNTTGTSSVSMSVDQMVQFAGVSNIISTNTVGGAVSGGELVARQNGGVDNAALTATEISYNDTAIGSADDIRVSVAPSFERIEAENIESDDLQAGEITAVNMQMNSADLSVTGTGPVQFSNINNNFTSTSTDKLNTGQLSVGGGIITLGNVDVTQEFRADNGAELNGPISINEIDINNLSTCIQQSGLGC